METFGQRLRWVRRGKDITLEVLSEAVGVTKATLSRYENDIRVPDINTANKIATYLGVTVDYLIGNPNNENIIKVSNDKEGEDILKYMNQVLLDTGQITPEEAAHGIKDEDKKQEILSKLRRAIIFAKGMNK